MEFIWEVILESTIRSEEGKPLEATGAQFHKRPSGAQCGSQWPPEGQESGVFAPWLPLSLNEGHSWHLSPRVSGLPETLSDRVTKRAGVNGTAGKRVSSRPES